MTLKLKKMFRNQNKFKICLSVQCSKRFLNQLIAGLKSNRLHFIDKLVLIKMTQTNKKLKRQH